MLRTPEAINEKDITIARQYLAMGALSKRISKQWNELQAHRDREGRMADSAKAKGPFTREGALMVLDDSDLISVMRRR